jgi:hypothetical protein
MSDKQLMNTQKTTAGPRFIAILALWLIITGGPGMSTAILAGSTTVPYDSGRTEEIPSAAARLCNLSCSRVPGGCAYTFDIEVFETCWTPVYAIELENALGGFAEPLLWPENWKSTSQPGDAFSAGSMVFYTTDHPITPGTVQAGFGLISYSGGMALRWFPADQEGILIGKMSRIDLSCPAGTDASSWGSIKAIYE